MLMMYWLSNGGLFLTLLSLFIGSNAFTVKSVVPVSALHNTILKESSIEEDQKNDTERHLKREFTKKKILQLGASYDRGFGASPKARRDVEQVISDLEFLNDEKDAAKGVDGNGFAPLQGNWRMVWTTASDVLVLGASPILSVGAIYQLYDPPIVKNVIDLIPRIQNLFPPNLTPSSLLRVEVKTRSSPRPSFPMRVGLDFESVELQPVEFLGQDAGSLPPLGFDLPRVFDLPDDVGYFDVTFLDEELLVIRQNSPGGLFVLARVDDTTP